MTMNEYSIEKSGDKWRVVGHKGDVKGTHNTEQEAKDQVKAIYANIKEAKSFPHYAIVEKAVGLLVAGDGWEEEDAWSAVDDLDTTGQFEEWYEDNNRSILDTAEFIASTIQLAYEDSKSTLGPVNEGLNVSRKFHGQDIVGIAVNILVHEGWKESDAWDAIMDIAADEQQLKNTFFDNDEDKRRAAEFLAGTARLIAADRDDIQSRIGENFFRPKNDNVKTFLKDLNLGPEQETKMEDLLNNPDALTGVLKSVTDKDAPFNRNEAEAVIKTSLGSDKVDLSKLKDDELKDIQSSIISPDKGINESIEDYLDVMKIQEASELDILEGLRENFKLRIQEAKIILKESLDSAKLAKLINQSNVIARNPQQVQDFSLDPSIAGYFSDATTPETYFYKVINAPRIFQQLNPEWKAKIQNMIRKFGNTIDGAKKILSADPALMRVFTLAAQRATSASQLKAADKGTVRKQGSAEDLFRKAAGIA